ncbi:hypothetical protein BDW71DRAFT_146291 [Aspergillus fruticulosus]
MLRKDSMEKTVTSGLGQPALSGWSRSRRLSDFIVTGPILFPSRFGGIVITSTFLGCAGAAHTSQVETIITPLSIYLSFDEFVSEELVITYSVVRSQSQARSNPPLLRLPSASSPAHRYKKKR